MQLFSIGHSNVPVERLIELLRQHAITTLCDVRSVPFSRFAPQFNRRVLEADARAAGLVYVFLGDALGGKPDDPTLLSTDGTRADYGKIAASPGFAAGLARLIALGHSGPTAFMCSEADFRGCHRHRLLVPALMAHGVVVQHILADGSTTPGLVEPQQTRMF